MKISTPLLPQAHFRAIKANGETFEFSSRGRERETLESLLSGPTPCPALTRRSDHVLHLRAKGLKIETRYQEQRTDGAARFGVYHLLDRVTRINQPSNAEAA